MSEASTRRCSCARRLALSHCKCSVQTGEREADRAPRYERTSRNGSWCRRTRAPARRLEEVSRSCGTWRAAPEPRREARLRLGVVTSGVAYQLGAGSPARRLDIQAGDDLPAARALVREFASGVDAARRRRGARPIPHVEISAQGSPSRTPRSPDRRVPPGRCDRVRGAGPAVGTPGGSAATSSPAVPGVPSSRRLPRLRKIKAVVTGDIGCYTLGRAAPTGSMDTLRVHGREHRYGSRALRGRRG